MPLDLGGGGDFNDIRWMAQDRTWRADGEDVDLKQAVFDLEHIKTGWISFAQGMAPEVVWDNGAKAPRPHTDAEWKRGFEVEVYRVPADRRGRDRHQTAHAGATPLASGHAGN